MQKTADFLIEQLKLLPHPEGGYYREIYRAGEIIPAAALPGRYEGDRNFSTAIYFLLKSPEVSVFHSLRSDEVWHFYDGSPLVLYLLDPQSGRLSTITLGRDVAEGQQLSYVAAAGVWMAAEVPQEGEYALVGCTVAPGFVFSDIVYAKRDELAEISPQHAALVARFTKS